MPSKDPLDADFISRIQITSAAMAEKHHWRAVCIETCRSLRSGGQFGIGAGRCAFRAPIRLPLIGISLLRMANQADLPDETEPVLQSALALQTFNKEKLT
jgi:hypothetical protein